MGRKRQKAVRLIKKVRLEPGRWQFVTIPRSGNRYLWDPRPLSTMRSGAGATATAASGQRGQARFSRLVTSTKYRTGWRARAGAGASGCSQTARRRVAARAR